MGHDGDPSVYFDANQLTGMVALDLDATQLDRYSRHLIMDAVGPEGQQQLLDSRVLCVGAGGLGSPAIEYLAAAGVGTLGIVDDDVVERSNLQRQVLHTEADIGTPKVESAAAFVEAQAPDVTVEPIERRLTKANAHELVASYDIVLDGSDNFPTRFLLNDVCWLRETPLVHGAVLRFEGQVTTIDPRGDGPCYRCLFPSAPPAGAVPGCATAGVLGVLPGTIGCFQATEVCKLIMEIGDPLVGRLLSYNASGMTTDTVAYAANPDCPICGTNGIDSIAGIDYTETCSIDDHRAGGS